VQGTSQPCEFEEGGMKGGETSEEGSPYATQTNRQEGTGRGARGEFAALPSQR
jgi:hypothetical protein